MSRRFYPPTESDIPMHGWAPYDEIHLERIRAHAKHDGNQESMERREWDDPSWLPVLVEEVGEAARTLNELRHRSMVPEQCAAELRAELIQVAAMATAWIEAIGVRARAKEGK